MPSCQPGLLTWCPIFMSVHCHLFECLAPQNYIYVCLIFKWVVETYREILHIYVSFLRYFKVSPSLQMMLFYFQFASSGGRFKNTYELLNLRALKISKLHKNHIFQCMGKIFCVEFQRVPLKFHTKYLTHTLKDVDFIHIWKFKSSLI